MAKAILVMDKRPENCLDCHVGFYSGGVVICRGIDDGKPHETWFPEHIPEYCPLKELPERKTKCHDAAESGVFDYGWATTYLYETAWNDCLDAIENGEGE